MARRVNYNQTWQKSKGRAQCGCTHPPIPILGDINSTKWPNTLEDFPSDGHIAGNRKSISHMQTVSE